MTLKTGVKMLKIQFCITEINYILKYIKMEKHYFKLFFFCVFFCVSDQINAALMSIRDFFKKYKQSY